MPLLYSCKVVKSLTQDLIDILKRANLLRFWDHIETFLFKINNFNSIENLSLVELWNYIYKSKFNTEKYSAIKFRYYLKQNVSQSRLLSPSLKSESQAVINVIEAWKGTAFCEYDRYDVNDD